MIKKLTFFSISKDFINPENSFDFDIYANSSSLKGRERYQRILKSGQNLSEDFYQEHIQKHSYLYVPETQRKKYFSQLVKSKSTENQKVEALKTIAIEHLESIFYAEKNLNNFLSQIEQSKDIVDLIVDLVQHQKMNDLQKIIGQLGYHDTYTFDHSINVCMYSIVFYKFLKPQASRFELATAGMSGLLHDLGKIKVSNKILNNVGPLTDEDFSIIKKHPNYGYELLKTCDCESISSDMLTEIEKVVLQHHENVNGTGYPYGIMSDEISFLSKLVAIIDFFDAVTTKRSYHEALEVKDALSLMEKSVGRKIDNNLFNNFKRSLYVLGNGRGDLRIEDDFDPCMPYAELPLVRIAAKKTTISLRTGEPIKEVDPLKKAS